MPGLNLSKPFIKLCTDVEFYKEISHFPLKNSVNYPYSAAEILKAENANTEGVCKCLASGMMNPVKDVILGHIAPNKYNIEHFDLVKRKISDFLNKKGERLHNLLFGGTEHDSSKKLTELFEDFYQKDLKVSYGKINGLQVNCPLGSDIACNAKENKFLLTNKFISEQLTEKRANFSSMNGVQIQKQLMEILKKAFKTVEIDNFELIA